MVDSTEAVGIDLVGVMITAWRYWKSEALDWIETKRTEAFLNGEGDILSLFSRSNMMNGKVAEL